MSILGNPEIDRAWVLIVIEDDDVKKHKCLSEEICSVGDETYRGDGMAMVIRADVTGGDFQMVVPISAAPGQLDEVVSLISTAVDAQDFEGETDIKVATVVAYNPSPSTLAACYVTEEEAFNPPKGKNKKGTGFNAWG